jgi:cellulose biosynthesis protein BcsQ
VASHLAAALADERKRCVLVDLDGSFADVSVALGVEPAADVRTIADLLAVADEMSPEHVEAALFRHSRKFDALLAPPEPLSAPPGAGLYCGAVALLAMSHDMVILHTPRSLDAVARAGLAMADLVVLVVSPDLFCLYSARRVMDALGIEHDPARCMVVVNPVVRGDVGMAEVERVLGIRPEALIRFDPAVGRAQDRGELVGVRSRRTWRDIRGLARRAAATASPPHPEQREE